MATRFAGDFFGVPLVTEKETRSSLLEYFPGLRQVKATGSDQEGARSFGGTEAAAPFVGFKTFEAPAKEKKAAPLFTGFKTPEFRAN